MSPKDTATAAAIIGNASTFQVIQKVKAVAFPPPSFLLVSLMKRKDCEVSRPFLLYLLQLKKRGRLWGRGYLLDLPVLVILTWARQVGKPGADVSG